VNAFFHDLPLAKCGSRSGRLATLAKLDNPKYLPHRKARDYMNKNQNSAWAMQHVLRTGA
jgi:hypothetical protein